MKHLTGLVEVYDWNPRARVLERKWEGLNYEVTDFPEPPRKKRVRRNPHFGNVASRASDMVKSRVERGVP